jgi:AcrR family transcriptional regulator
MAGSTKAHKRQVGSSRACIVEALLSLMKKVPYTKITVSDIIRKAGLARPTFYRHYENKDDVIIQFLEGCFAPSDLEIKNQTVSSEDFNKGYVYLMSLPLKKMTRHGAALKIILNSEAEYLVYQYGEKWEAHEMNLIKDTLKPREINDARYRLLFSIAGSTQVICDWIKNDMPIPVEKLIEWLRVKNRALAGNPVFRCSPC